MTDWKRIKEEAENIKKQCKNIDDIIEKFNNLLSEHPNDPMVYYIRGETYESFGDKIKACNDYALAYNSFPKQEWKEKAKDAMKRVCDKNN